MLHQDLAHDLGHPLSSLTDDAPVDTVWLNFKKVMLAAQDKYVPSKFSSNRYLKPWINRECKCRKTGGTKTLKEPTKGKTGKNFKKRLAYQKKLVPMHTMTSLRQQLKVNKTRSFSALSKQNAHK